MAGREDDRPESCYTDASASLSPESWYTKGSDYLRPESSCTENSDCSRPESCYTAASYTSNKNDADQSGGYQLKALRLTRARLWVMCELLTALHGDMLAPVQFRGQSSLVDKAWKQKWLAAVQTPLNSAITNLDRLSDVAVEKMCLSMQNFKAIRAADATQLTNKTCDMLRKKSESTPECQSRDKVVVLRVIRTTLLVLGELCGDLGEDHQVPAAFRNERSLLKQAVDINNSNRSKNKELTQDCKDNLKKMQESMAQKAWSLYSDNIDLYNQIIGKEPMVNLCEKDAEELDEKCLIPFARECNNWEVEVLTASKIK